MDAIFIYLDDVRNPPSDEWIIERNANGAYSAIRLLYADNKDRPIVVSLDHDLGTKETGYDVLNWIEKDIAIDPSFRPQISFLIHSANPVGRARMESAIASIQKLLGEENET